MKKFALFICALFLIFCVQAQSQFDMINIGRAKKVAQMNFGQNYTLWNHLVFIMNKQVMLVYDTPTQYNFVFYNVKNDVSGKEIISFSRSDLVLKEQKQSKQKELNYLFLDTCSICRTNQVFFPQDIGNNNIYQAYNYFVLYRNGRKICEYNVPYAFIDDYKGYNIPLEDRYLFFLFSKMLN